MPDTFAPSSPQDDLEALLDTVWREEARTRLDDRMDAALRADELAKKKPTRARKAPEEFEMSYGISIPKMSDGQVVAIAGADFPASADEAIAGVLPAFDGNLALRERVEEQLRASKSACESLIDSGKLGVGPFKATVTGHAELEGGTEWVTINLTAENPHEIPRD